MNSDFGTALVNKLPWQATFSLVVLILIALLYVVRHIKRDKQGKWYWYSAAYEGSKKGYKEVQELLKQHISNDKLEYDRIYESLRDLQSQHDCLKKDVEQVTEYDKNNYMMNLKQSVFTDKMPLADRIYDGLRFIKAGGNHTVKEEVIRLKETYPEVFKTVIDLKPELGGLV